MTTIQFNSNGCAVRSHKIDFGAPRLALTYPAIMAACAFGIFFVTRVVLAVFSAREVGFSTLPHILFVGLWFDFVATGTLLAPFLLANAIIPERIRKTRAFAWFCYVVIWFFVATLLFSAVGEYLFWDEFSARYNFIAVDYLVYTQEVLANIFQSYPVKTLLAVIAVAAAAIVWTLRRWLYAVETINYRASTRLGMLALGIAWPMLSLAANVEQMRGSGNAIADELSGNGLYSLVSAFFLNELDYDRFYATLPDETALGVLKGLNVPRSVSQPSADLGGTPDTTMPSYLIRRPKNVVMVTVESLSAEFLGTYGDKRGLTPNLDRIASQGLVFDRMFATGTRTVRGLEATSLGTPPVPGQAIVRRPKSNHLTTIGEVLHHRGFETTFAYGGNAYFDNMAGFFGSNAYGVLDRGGFPDGTVAFENAWGVADESLFSNVETRLDQQASSGKPFFIHVMTTSNHRPFTYPDGRIDIPSPGGRDGAVKYTDDAIGRFLKSVATKPWFADTLFVILADHCASVAGATELPVEKYHIPMIFYGPQIVKPGHIAAISSQIDVPPTILRALGVSGEQYFFGRAIDADSALEDRAFISNYQSLGYLKNGVLTVLRPKKVVESFLVDDKTLASTPAPVDQKLRNEAIAYYQTASREFRDGALRAPW